MNRNARSQRFPVGCTSFPIRPYCRLHWLGHGWCPRKWRLSLWLFAALLLLAKVSMAAPADIAAMVGDQPILVRELDKQSTTQLSRLHDECSALLVRTV